MCNKESNLRPQTINAGGIFISMLKAAIQPISCIVMVPLSLMLPGLSSAFYYHIFSKQNSKIINFRKGISESFTIKPILISQFSYMLFLALAFRIIADKTSKYLEAYKEKASQNNVLQIATPEQLEYSHNLTFMYSIFALLLFFTILFIAYYIVMRCYEKENGDFSCRLKLVTLSFLKNLHIHIMIFLVFYFIFLILETYFARYKLLYLEGYILDHDTFDPTVPFLAIRLYLLHILFYVINHVVLASLGIKKIVLKE